MFYLSVIKPLADRVAAVFLFFLALPVTAIIALCLFWVYRGKVIFRQRRIGYREKPFTIYKFRTLLDKKDAAGNLLSDSERSFPFGLFVRRFHLDELPQLINVLNGDISFIGPRPLLPEYVSLYSPAQRLRHSVKPGMTGLAQIMGGNLLPWPARLRLDSFYARKAGPALDCLILKKTIAYIFSAKPVVFSESFVEYWKREKQG